MIESSAAPDAAEPLVGYRVWTLRDDGLLRPHAVGNEPWAIGVNEAQCLTQGHFAPTPNCGCGLNALHRPPAHYLADRASAVGAIAAWGTIDLFRTGFRAELGCVVALAMPPNASDAHVHRLRLAAETYDVPLVDVADLREAASAHARPASEELLPGPRRPRGAPATKRHYAPPPRQSLAAAMRGDGVWLEKHLAVAHDGPEAWIGPTPALSAVAGNRFAHACEPGKRISEGAPLFRVLAGGRELDCPSPMAGMVDEVRFPDRGRLGGPRADGWLVKVRVDPEPPDYWPLLWGAAGADAYRSHVLATESDAAFLASLTGGAGASASAVNPGGWLAEFCERLDMAIRADATIREALQAIGLRVVWELRDGATMSVGPPRSTGEAWAKARGVEQPDLIFEVEPTALARYWEGRLVLSGDTLSVGPLRAGRAIEVDRRPAHLSRGTRAQAIFAMSIHRRLLPAAREAFAELGNPWFRAGDAVRDGERNRIALGGVGQEGASMGALG